MSRLWLVVALLLAAPAQAQDVIPESAAQVAARSLSRYPTGEVPTTRSALRAVLTLGETGTSDEVPLLIHLARHEQARVSLLSIRALADVREHVSAEELERVNAELAPWPSLDRAVRRLAFEDAVASTEP